jgi:hypothetical protein
MLRRMTAVGLVCAISLLACRAVLGIEDWPGDAASASDGAVEGDAYAPTLLAGNLGAPHGILVNGASFYVAESGGTNVYTGSKVDGGYTVFAPALLGPDRLATDGNTLFWTDDVNLPGSSMDPAGAVYTGPSTFCTNQAACFLASDLPAPYGIAVQGSTVFFTTVGSTNNSGSGCPTTAWVGSVLSCPTTGSCAVTGCAMDAGGPKAIATQQTQLRGIAADETNVYWADPGDHVVRFCSQPNCLEGAQTFAMNVGSPFDVVSNGTTVFFTDRTGNLYACPTTGCGSAQPTPLASGLTDPLLVAVDSKNVYVTLYAGGAIAWCLLPSCVGGPTMLATGRNHPYGIVSDGTYIYWTEEGSSGPTSTDGAVYKLRIQ